MRKTVRFVSDTEGYVAGDFGDHGEETMAKIESGDLIVVGMVVFDAEAVNEEVEDSGLAYETAVHHHTIDSLWCIAVPSAAIDDCDRDITDPTTVKDDYLRSLATDHLMVTLPYNDLCAVMANFGWPGPFSPEVESAVERVRTVLR